jgi:hypothetical protein
VIVPVATVQVGCVGVAVGAARAGGAALIVTGVAADIHPSAFFTVTLYALGARPVNIPVVLV